ncbi:Uncharacterized membrane protein [Sporobacter termitidis DSM 10068]|uniref:Uncharacterized membrane protein n=1 Tax=Sporobacter termitidis DSM 10068 TaxID=1123282 RepID=A0A1M5Z719_9FIRM|nr:putative ABC transporter permease [Sporobacter termitidis]SHI19888.1 Uncharacterized membrane protein [Sporobacter termitidis DSM 10068]
MHFMSLFLWFVIYSFIGWAWETVLFTVQEKRFINRGFLNGPLCPVYGVGALLLLWALNHKTGDTLLLFLAALVLTTALEYLTALLLEKLFHAKWWDYSMFPLNFQGRISLISSVVFAVMAVLLIRYIHPFVSGLTGQISAGAKQVFFFIFTLYLVIDLALTVRHVLLLNGRLSEIQSALNCFLGKYTRLAGEFKNAILVSFEESEFYSDRIRILFNLDRLQSRRILKAFPKFRSLNYNEALCKLRDRLLGQKDGGGNDE